MAVTRLTHELTQSFHAAAAARSAGRQKAPALQYARKVFTIRRSADQRHDILVAMAEGKRQQTSMPKREDEGLTGALQCLQVMFVLDFEVYRSEETAECCGRKQGYCGVLPLAHGASINSAAS